MLFQKKYLIGQELVRRGRLAQDDLDFALMEHERKGTKLGRILVKCGFISEEDLLEVLSDQLGVKIQKVIGFEIPQSTIQRIPAKMAREYGVLPIGEEDGVLTICLSGPLDQKQLDAIKAQAGSEIKIVIDSDKNLLASIKKYYGLVDDEDLEFLEEGEI